MFRLGNQDYGRAYVGMGVFLSNSCFSTPFHSLIGSRWNRSLCVASAFFLFFQFAGGGSGDTLLDQEYA